MSEEDGEKMHSLGLPINAVLICMQDVIAVRYSGRYDFNSSWDCDEDVLDGRETLRDSGHDGLIAAGGLESKASRKRSLGAPLEASSGLPSLKMWMVSFWLDTASSESSELKHMDKISAYSVPRLNSVT